MGIKDQYSGNTRAMVSTLLTQTDTPCISFCQKPDCSGVTMSIGRNDYFSFYHITNVTLEITCGAYTSGVQDITTSIISPLIGTIDYTYNAHDINGTNTAFTTELEPGDEIVDSEYPFYIQKIYSITSDTAMETVNMIYRAAPGGTTFKKLNTEYLVAPSFLGMPYDLMPDGEYSAELNITVTGGQVLTITQNFAVICNNFCCLYEKLAAFADMCDDCMTNENMKKILDAMMAWGMLEAYLAAPYCGDTVSFATLNTKLTELCNSTPCKNC